MNPPDGSLPSPSAHLIQACPSLPRDTEGEPVFQEPWQAKAFALTMLLHERGAFSWSDWSATLAEECAGPAPYFEAWVRALERLLARGGLATPDRVEAVTNAWHRAAEATPHGTPITLGKIDCGV